MRYTNPIIPGFHPDPSICRVGEDYYLVTSSFEYFPGVPIFHSRDLLNWKQIGHCLTRKSQLPLDGARSSGGIYAPTIRHHAGRFYMITTNVSHRGNFFVTTENPSGEWSDPVWIDDGSIDPSLLFDAGKVYFCTNGSRNHKGLRGIFQAEIDVATGKLLTPMQHLWTGTGGAHPEGPHVFRRGQYYYLLMAEGGTEFGHMVTLARSTSVNGPYEPCPHNPILSHRSLDQSLQSLGHADLFEDHTGQWWVVFLACRHVGYPKMHHIGRETNLAPVEWTEDHWPIVNGGRPVALEVDTDRPIATQRPSATARDDFDSPQFAFCWNFRRNPDPAMWSLDQGQLTLHCIPATLNDIASPAFVGRRQEHLACTAKASLDLRANDDGDEAGLTVLMNETHHCDVAITQRNGKRVALLRRTVGTLTWESPAVAVPAGPLTLEVSAIPEWYEFSITAPSSQPVGLGKAETRHLSTELAGGFTGVYFGMYATGNGRSSAGEAAFDWFEYTPA